MDDTLIYSDTINNRVKHVRIILDALKYRNLKIKTKKMQIPCTKSHAFGLRHHSRTQPNGNNQNRQHPNLASTQKHKRFTKIIRIHKVIPKYGSKIRGTDIFHDKPVSNK